MNYHDPRKNNYINGKIREMLFKYLAKKDYDRFIILYMTIDFDDTVRILKEVVQNRSVQKYDKS